MGYADCVDYDAVRLGQLGLVQRVRLLDVRRAVRDQDQDRRHARTRTVRLGEHLL